MRYVWKIAEIKPSNAPSDFEASLVGETEQIDDTIYIRIVLKHGDDRFVLKSNHRKIFGHVELSEVSDEHKFDKEYHKIKKWSYQYLSMELQILRNKQKLKGS